MTDAQSTHAEDEPSKASMPRQLRKILIGMLIALTVLCLIALWLWHGPGSTVIASTRSFDMQRLADGSWPSIPQEEPNFSVSLTLGLRTCTTKDNSSQGISATQSARFAGRSIAVIAMHKGRLNDAIARLLIADLQRDPEVHSIRFVAYEDAHSRADTNANTNPGRTPDIALAIHECEYHENTFAGSGSIDATAMVTASDHLARGVAFVESNDQAPHAVNFRLHITAQATVRQDGLTTPNAQFTATAQDLAKAITTKLRNSFSEMRKQYGVFPQLPALFYPEYRPIDDTRFALSDIFASTDDVRAIASWHGQLRHNESWWHGRVAGSKQDAFAQISERLTASGWRAPQQTHGNTTFRRGTLEVTLSGEPEVHHVGMTTMVSDAPATSTNIFVRYIEHADQETRTRAFESVLTDESQASVLLMSSPVWNADQRRRGAALIASRQLHQPEDLVLRARMRSAAKDDAGAREDLRRAICSAQTSFGREGIADRARTAAKQLDLTIDDSPPSNESLIDAGLHMLVVGQDAIDLEITRDNPARCFIRKDVSVTLCTIGLKPNKDGQWRFAVRTIDGGTQTEQSDIHGGTTRQSSLSGTLEVEFLGNPEDEVVRIRVAVQ